MARVGKIHMLNNYYSCSGASLCMNPRKESEFLIEGNYFDTGVKNYYKNNDATAVSWTSNNHIAEASSLPTSSGTVTVPYTVTAAPCAEVPTEVKAHAGAKLENTTGISTPVTISTSQDVTYYNIKGQRVAHPTKGLYIVRSAGDTKGKKVFIK